MRQLTQARVRQLFSYNKRTGLLCRKISIGGRGHKGHIAGCVENERGYLSVVVDGRKYRVAHVIWIYVTGKKPKKQIDHKNLKTADNRWVNLREATNSQNKCNNHVRSNSETGVKGVTIEKRTGRFRVHICVNNKRTWLGYFPTLEAAAAVRRNAGPKFHGEFSRSA